MSNYKVKITGDNSGLRRSTDEAIDMLDNLSDKALNLDLSGGLKGLGGTLRGIGGAAGLAVGGITAVAGATLAAANAAAEYVRQYNEVSKATGVSVETLQKLEKEFSGTGLTIEKFGDINKDAMDKMADAIRNGGGIEDDLESVGLKLKDYLDLVNDPEGGLKAAIRVFYDMKKAGASLADVKFMMESLASDSSHLTSTLDRYGSAQEAINAINQNSVKITNETAKEYQTFDQNMQTLEGHLKGMAVSGLNPVVKEMNALWKVLDDKDWENVKFIKMLSLINDSKTITKGDNALVRAAKRAVKSLNPFGSVSIGGVADLLDKALPDDKTDNSSTLPTQQASISQEIKTKSELDAEEEAQKAAQKAQEKALKAAEKAAEEAKRRREQALKDLNSLNIQIYGQTQAAVASSNAQIVESLSKLDNALKEGVITQEQYQEKRKALINANADNFYESILGMQPTDAMQALAASKQVYDQSISDLQALYDSRLISHQDYLARKAALDDAYNARQAATSGLADQKFAELSSSIGGFGFEEDFANQKAEADRQLMEDQRLINNAGLPEEQRMKLLEQAERKHKQTLIDIEQQAANARMSIVNDMFGGMGAALDLFGMKNSAAGKAMFAAQKGVAIAQATMDTYAAANKALNSAPAPMSYALAAQAVAKGIANVAQIKSTSIDGMAHDGIDNIPREGTWLLQKGERVVDDRTNGDLKEFLSNQNSSSSNNMQPIQVSAPLNIQGSVHSSDKAVMEAIKRHPQMVAQAVQDAQRRRM